MANDDFKGISDNNLLELTTNIVASYISNNQIAAQDLPTLVVSVHKTVADLATPPKQNQAKPKPAVAVSKSVTDEFIICLEDGRKLKMMKRYLKSRYDMSPDEYRERWNLPADYPMVAPDYAKKRSEFAKEIGLGKSKKQ